ncbi:MAG: hypothetical protein AABY64_13480 [Bdellovibrionota bacterium]
MEKIEEKQFEKTNWIKELVNAEQKVEDTGMIDLNPHVDQQRVLAHETLQYLLNLKVEFYDASNIYNELKTSPLGRVKVYGVAHTHADFMLFRNGYKMLFTLKAPGLISIRMNFIGANMIPTPGTMEQNQNSTKVMEEVLLEAQLGPFNEVTWTYQSRAFNTMNLVRHYLSLFLRESIGQ